jgi:hypothetical protein
MAIMARSPANDIRVPSTAAAHKSNRKVNGHVPSIGAEGGPNR